MQAFLSFLILIFGLSINTANCLVNPCKKGITTNHFFSHPEDQSKYIQCTQWGQMFVFSCPESLIWNLERLTCERKNVFSFFQPTALPIQSTKRFVDTSTTKIVPKQEILPNQKLQLPTTTLEPIPRVIQTISKTVNEKQPAKEEIVLSSNDCSIISITDSFVPVVDGLYTKINSNIFRRSDNLNIPALIVRLSSSKWCLTLSFSSTDLDSITAVDIEKNCGSNLECCMLVSSSSSQTDLAITKKDWIINILDNKGKEDVTMKIDCKNLKRGCVKIPFCPPECLKNVDGCDVCECNGKSFFKVIDQKNKKMIEQNPILEQGQSQQIESQILDGTIPSRFQQKLLPLSGNFKNQKNDSKTQIPINGPEDLFIITTCDKVTCPASLVCATASNCKTCNPMCFPQDKIDIAHGVKLNCQSVMCPSDFTCLADPNDDNKLKCIISPLISANNPLTITIKEESAIKEFHKASNLESEKPDFPIKFCNMVSCPNNLVCAEASNCNSCNPMCFPKNNINIANGLKLSCQNVKCPAPFKCFDDIFDNILKCVI